MTAATDFLKREAMVMLPAAETVGFIGRAGAALD